ncbi:MULTISPECIES: YchJ family protein [Luteimonas]|uniref:YchJ family protein n=1 Tax=Luteimonas TaxID=83614 RepID=UPI000C7BB718|nr:MULTISPECIES: YchJ family metal-binding protein [Luteimonas]
MSSSNPCPCGLPSSYAACCGRYHAGVPAPDAEALMRSRYSAYVRRDADYLRATWDPTTRPATLDFDGPQPVWLGLDVRSHQDTGDDRAEVAFVARYRVGGGSVVRLREHSRFRHDGGRWWYVDGDVA